MNKWSQREINWFNAEGRFLFAFTEREKCEKWVCLLKFLCNRIKDSEF